MYEAQPSVLEMGVGVQVMTPAVVDEVNTARHPEEVSMESHEMIPLLEDHALEPVTLLTEENFSHIPNSWPLFAISSNPPSTRPLEVPQCGSPFQAYVVESTAITIEHAIVTSNAPSTIPTDGSATLEPILILTLGAPALVVDTIMLEHQLEIIVNPSAADGRGLAMVPLEGALLPLLDQPFGHIFDFLNQWDASISLVEASTHIATSSTMVRPYQIPGLRHYFGHVVMETS
ncbi:unnamed protein product [Prunus armeniaca]